MQTSWDAHYFDGRTPATHRAVVRVLPLGLEVTVEGGDAVVWRYRELRQTQGRYAGEQVRLERGRGATPEVLVLSDRRFLEPLQGRITGSAETDAPSRTGKRLALTIGAGVGALALLAGLYLWGIPAVAALLAPRVPPAWESRLGEAVLPHLAPPARRCTAAPLDNAVRELVDRLIAPLAARPYTIRVVVVRDRRVNAFALPGGTIVLLSGLVEGAGSAEEVAAVLAHELQHILRRHATRALLEQASTGLLLAGLTGDPSGLLGYGLQGAHTLAMLRYSRRNEEEADAEGLRMLVAAGIDPGAMVAFLERLQAREGRGSSLPAYLSTHPDTAARIAGLRSEAARHRFPPLTLAGDWPTIARACAQAAPRSQTPGAAG